MSKAKVVVAAFVAVLALSAIASTTASAATAGWMVKGSLLSGAKALAPTAAVTENAKLTFSAITVECTGKTLNGLTPQIESPNKGSAASLTFTECKTTEPPCKLEGTSISTVPINVEATLEGSSEVKAAFTPKTKTTFTTLKFLGAECSVSSEIQPVTGKATVKGPTGQTEKEGQEIVANTASGELKVGSAAAVLKGKAVLKLASGEAWSFL